VNAELLESAAIALGPLLDEVVFVGGASIHLWLSDLPRRQHAQLTMST
jgi:hypothetical protein